MTQQQWHDWKVWSLGYWMGGLVTLGLMWLVMNIV